jgi:hypothetical protein
MNWKKLPAKLFYALPEPAQKLARVTYYKALGGMNRREIRRVRGEKCSWNGTRGKVLFAPLRYWPIHLAWESVVAHGLRARGFGAEFLVCDECFTACDYRAGGKVPESACGVCHRNSAAFLDEFAIPSRKLGSLLDGSAKIPEGSLAELRATRVDGDPVGEWSYQSLCRYLLVGNVPDTPENRAVYRKFVEGAARCHRGFSTLLDRERYHAVFLCNGKFFVERVLFELARRRGIDVLTYERGRIQETLVFSWNGFANDGADDATWRAATAAPLTPAQEKQLTQYLEDRVYGKHSTTDPWNLGIRDAGRIKKELKLDGRPLFVLYTNLLWDTSVLEKDIGFASHAAWLRETVAWFAARPELQLVIRVHPAEARLQNLQTKEKIADLFPTLPANVVLVASTSDISSYTLMEMADAVLVYATNAGMEAVLRGKPAICAGRAHYYGRGVTLDVATREEYFAKIESWRSLQPTIDSARRYAYFFFFQTMIPFPVVREHLRGETTGRDFKFAFDDIEELAAQPAGDLARIVEAIERRSPLYCS